MFIMSNEFNYLEGLGKMSQIPVLLHLYETPFIMNQLANNYLFKNGITELPVCFSYPHSVIRESVNDTS